MSRSILSNSLFTTTLTATVAIAVTAVPAYAQVSANPAGAQNTVENGLIANFQFPNVSATVESGNRYDWASNLIVTGANGEFGQLFIEDAPATGGPYTTTVPETLFADGNIFITSGGSMEHGSASTSRLYIGFNPDADGLVLVSGFGTLLESGTADAGGFFDYQLHVGYAGDGRLHINNGGVLRAPSGNGPGNATSRFGTLAGSTAEVNLANGGSKFDAPDMLAVFGDQGSASMELRGGARFICSNFQAAIGVPTVDLTYVIAFDLLNATDAPGCLETTGPNGFAPFNANQTNRINFELDMEGGVGVAPGDQFILVTYFGDGEDNYVFHRVEGDGSRTPINEGDSYVVDDIEFIINYKTDLGDGKMAVTATVAGFDGCPADLDGDGQVNAVDLLDLLAAWGECNGCPADINGDTSVDSVDLLALLAVWGECE